ncbi:NAD-dependent epimerase/dehydratase family protein [Chloroflexota bacterium]
MREVVITGGVGFIGSHLTEELVREDYHVTILDDLSNGKLGNIEGVLDIVEFVKDSISNLSLLLELFSGADCVFHQVAIPGVPRSINRLQDPHETNLAGTLNVLMAARDNQVNIIIYASSSSVHRHRCGGGEYHDGTERCLWSIQC